MSSNLSLQKNNSTLTFYNRCKKFYKGSLKRNIPLYVMFMPVFIYYIVFRYIPIGGLIMAFKDYRILKGIIASPWIGFENFKFLFSNTYCLKIIYNTVFLRLISIVIGFPIPIILAILINEVKKKWFKSSVQTLLYLPYFLSWVVVAGMVTTIFGQSDGSIVNHFVKMFSGKTIPFMNTPSSWIAIFVGSSVWKDAGFNAILFLSALTAVDQSLYEASALDGADKLKQIWHVTLPGITSTIIVVLILSLGKVMQMGFDQVYMLQNAAVNDVADVIVTYIYKVGIQQGNFSLTSAMSLFESLIGFIFIFTANKIARRFGENLW
jgi:putative aldouronate transport system permease protein